MWLLHPHVKCMGQANSVTGRFAGLVGRLGTRISKRHPPKRKAEEKALSDSKKPKVGPSHDRGTDSPVS